VLSPWLGRFPEHELGDGNAPVNLALHHDRTSEDRGRPSR
jgi:hypothetical protein